MSPRPTSRPPSDAHSKEAENHVHALSISLTHCNFMRIHKMPRVTPVIAAGVTNTLRDLPDMAQVLEEGEARQSGGGSDGGHRLAAPQAGA